MRTGTRSVRCRVRPINDRQSELSDQGRKEAAVPIRRLMLGVLVIVVRSAYERTASITADSIATRYSRRSRTPFA